MDKVRRSLLTALIDREDQQIHFRHERHCKKAGEGQIFFVIKQQYMAKIQEGAFSIPGGCKDSEHRQRYGGYLSIGIGMNGDSYSQNYGMPGPPSTWPWDGGGDQAVVKDSGKIQYYGGKGAADEKTTRVRPRVKAHALRELMENKDRLLIMGHRLADIGSFGAAVGIRIAVSMNKKANIVVNEVTSSVRPMLDRFMGNSDYRRICS